MSGSPVKVAGRNAGFDYRERIAAAADGEPVLEYLARRYRHSSSALWRERLLEGRVLVDAQPVGPDARLRRGQCLVWRRPPWTEPDAPEGFAVLYRDAALLVVAKPAGLPTLPGGGFLTRTLLAQVQGRYPEATPLHRLDRGASGLVLCARTGAARDRLAEAFRTGAIEKEYRALVTGEPLAESFDIDAPIGRLPHPHVGTVAAPAAAGTQGARPARTAFRVLERRGVVSLVAAFPITGRPHQIRIHLAVAGHPLAGDPLYAPGGHPRDSGRPGDIGYFLHAMRLRFRHPEGGAPVEVTCHPPEVLRPALTPRRRTAI